MLSNDTLRVLAIPELLDMIFRFLDDVSNASNVRVCRRWSEVALNVLWQDVTDVSRLFNILAPLKAVGGDILVFDRNLEPADWKTFGRYRRRVKSLSYKVSNDKVIHQSAFDEIARSRTSLDIFPNLHTLEWNAALGLCVIFMHKNIKSFAVTLPDDDLAGLSSFLQNVGQRMQNLTHLDLRLRFSIRTIEPNIVELLSDLHNLRKLTVPRFCFTSEIAKAASRNRHLEAIDFQYYEHQGVGNLDDVANFDPSLQEGAYQSLHELCTTVSFRHATAFLTKPFSPSNLKAIYLESAIIELPADILDLVTTIAENCPLLKTLALLSAIDQGTLNHEPYDKEHCVAIDHLRPLFKCPNLVSLDITHQYPLQLQLADIEEIAKAWPSVESLSLNNEPFAMNQSDLTLNALLPFARHCPKLHTLGLFINATTVDLEPISGQNFTYPPFRALRNLSMGVSIVSDEGEAALFLSQICPLGCNIESGVTWESPLGNDPETWKTIENRYEKWDQVKQLLPLLTKLRMEEKERARLLKRQVEDLRMRTSVLTDQASLITKVDGCITI